MKMSDMRAKARAIFGPAIAEPMPKQPNGAKALQERANARPIPTYKVGGAVKKNTPPQPTAAEREADRKRREEYAKMKVTPENAAAIARGNRAAAIEGGRYKKGGKVQTSADTAKKLATEMGGMKKGGKAKKDGLAVMIAIGEAKKPRKGMMDGGEIPMDTRASKLMAAGGAGKTRKGQAPIKKAVGGRIEGRGGMDARGKVQRPMPEPVMAARQMPTPVAPPPPPEKVQIAPVKRAQGGAGKVRKGMMTPEGKITHAMNKVRGK